MRWRQARALVLGAAAVLGGGCGKTAACKDGSFLLSIELPAAAWDADTLAITAVLPGAPPDTKTLPHASGQRTGTVEVAFAAYPAGQTVTVTVEALRAGALLASATKAIAAAPDCTREQLALAAPTTDGAAPPDGPLVPPRDGPGAPLDSAPADLRSMDLSAADLPSLSDLPAADLSSPDLAPPVDGAACVPRGPENQGQACWNGLDDDCNGLIDCADPACQPIAQCLSPLPGAPGIAVPATAACPPGFGPDSVALGNGVIANACTGCLCTPGAAGCSGNVFVYYAGQCLLDVSGTGGDPKFVDTAQTCGPRPYNDPNVTGVRLGPLTPRQGACSVGGVPTRPPPRWTNQARFCLALRGGGCPGSQVCLPRPPAVPAGPRMCAISPGTLMCPAGLVRAATDWYAAFNDTRTCTPCSCGAPSPASCAGVRAQLGPQGMCEVSSSVIVNQGAPPMCLGIGGQLPNPGMRLVGMPTAGTCSPRTDTMGTVLAASPQTICCAP